MNNITSQRIQSQKAYYEGALKYNPTNIAKYDNGMWRSDQGNSNNPDMLFYNLEIKGKIEICLTVKKAEQYIIIKLECPSNIDNIKFMDHYIKKYKYMKCCQYQEKYNGDSTILTLTAHFIYEEPLLKYSTYGNFSPFEAIATHFVSFDDYQKNEIVNFCSTYFGARMRPLNDEESVKLYQKNMELENELESYKNDLLKITYHLSTAKLEKIFGENSDEFIEKLNKLRLANK